MKKLVKMSFPIAAGLAIAVVTYKLLDEHVIKPLYKES
jgi:hypothetical protein